MYTSLGYGVCTLAAALAREYVYCFLFIVQNNCSALHHAHLASPRTYTGGRIISYLDHKMAFIIICKGYYDTLTMSKIVASPIWFTILYVIILHRLKVHNHQQYKENIIYYAHASMHIISQLGLIYLIFIKYQMKNALLT